MSIQAVTALRSQLFELEQGEHETMDEWQRRVTEKASKAELDKLDGEAIIGLIMLTRMRGPKV